MKLRSGQIHYGLTFANDGHGASVFIDKRLKTFSLKKVYEIACQVDTLLNGHLSYLRMASWKCRITGLQTRVADGVNISLADQSVETIHQ